MELDDLFYTGKRLITLRSVLGLMEDADNSLETYHWATPALLHAIRTRDNQLSDYVEDLFQKKGMVPYRPYQEEKKEEPTPEETLHNMRMNDVMVRSKAKMAIEELMALKDEEGKELFCRKNHWWAVYRLFVDHQVCNMRENHYKEFIELIDSFELEHMNAPLDMATLSNISQDVFRYPFSRWELKAPANPSSRWKTAFNRMNLIGQKLKVILITKGF